MTKITLFNNNKNPAFSVYAYKAGETVRVFDGATGVFGKEAGSKTAGIVYVTHGAGSISAEDQDVDNPAFWKWVQELMQQGLNAQYAKDKAGDGTSGQDRESYSDTQDRKGYSVNTDQ